MKRREARPLARLLKTETKAGSMHKQGQRLLPDPSGADSWAAVEALRGWCNVPFRASNRSSESRSQGSAALGSNKGSYFEGQRRILDLP